MQTVTAQVEVQHAENAVADAVLYQPFCEYRYVFQAEEEGTFLIAQYIPGGVSSVNVINKVIKVDGVVKCAEEEVCENVIGTLVEIASTLQYNDETVAPWNSITNSITVLITQVSSTAKYVKYAG